MERARRLISSLWLPALIVSCTLVESYDVDTNRRCPGGHKACGDKCVALDDPATGCASATCAPCDLPNATAACGESACKVVACANGFDDCDGVATNGCEANLNNDVLNCA